MKLKDIKTLEEQRHSKRFLKEKRHSSQNNFSLYSMQLGNVLSVMNIVIENGMGKLSPNFGQGCFVLHFCTHAFGKNWNPSFLPLIMGK